MMHGARERGRAVNNGREVIDAARAGEAWAIDVVTEAGQGLGMGLVTFANLFAPSVIGIAGGLSQAADLLGPPAEAWFRQYGIPANTALATIRWLGPADRFAIVGAATSARQSL